MDKKAISERGIYTKFITPALERAGWDRILLVMATGTGKTFTAFQIIWRLWKAKQKKRMQWDGKAAPVRCCPSR